MKSLCIAALASLALIATAHAQEADPTTAEARRADIAAFRTQFFEVDQSYSEQARASAEARITQLDRDVETLSQAQFELELSRIVALADNGHTAFFAGPRSRRYNRVTVRLSAFGEDFYVLRAPPEHADLLGARLVSVDGRSVATLRDVGQTLNGGVLAWRDRQVNYFLESPEQMHALGAISRADGVRYRFALPNGRTVTRTLTADPANPDRIRANSDQWYYPELMEAEGDAWRAALPLERAPWAWQEPTKPFRMRDAPEIDAFVIELRQNNSSADMDIAEFLLHSLEAARTSGRRNIVLDMRLNGGGDLNTTRAWVRRLPRVVPGRIFVLTSPWTFSAGISTIGYLKQAAPDRVTIVGEAVGDRLDFWAEGDVTVLPHSGAAIAFATERHDYRTGCRDIETCHGPVVRYPIAVESLAPDIAAPWTIEAYLAGRDPAMEAVAAVISATP